MTALPADHRPWPRSRQPWAMAMSWLDLLFMHWPVPAAALRPHIPPQLQLQTFDGVAWLGVVPFRMAGVRPRMVPELPWISAFPELNVRTYVTDGRRPGVWFFSLDAANPLAVEVARLSFHLPYQRAQMACAPEGDGIRYISERTHAGSPPAGLAMRYRPAGPVYRAAPGTLEHWLTERYCLYAASRRGRVWRGEIDHLPWPLQPAEAEAAWNTMAAPLGLRLAEPPAHLHFIRRLDVLAWLPDRISG